MLQNILAAVIAGVILGSLSLIWKIVLILLSKGQIPWRSLGAFIWRIILVITTGFGLGTLYGFTYWYFINSMIGGRIYFIFWAILGTISSLLWFAFRWKETRIETTPVLLHKWVKDLAQNIVSVQPLTFTFENIEMICLHDQAANRMRVMSFVRDAQKLPPEKTKVLLDSHFNSALDAHYAIYNNKLMAVFLHPLKSLSEEDFASALNQIVNLILTFNKEPKGGNLRFVGGDAVDSLDSEQ